MDSTTLMRRYAAGEQYFSGVDLHGADLTEAILGGADFTDADLYGTIFHGADATSASALVLPSRICSEREICKYHAFFEARYHGMGRDIGEPSRSPPIRKARLNPARVIASPGSLTAHLLPCDSQGSP